MSNEQKKSNLQRIGNELTDGAGTNEFSSNEPLIQENTGWDSSRYNQWPAGPFSDIGFGHNNQETAAPQDFPTQNDEAEEYTVRTSWGSGTKDLPDISNEGPRDPDGKQPSVGVGSGNERDRFAGIDKNSSNNQGQPDLDRAEGGRAGTHDLGEILEDENEYADDDDVSDEDDSEISFNDDDEEMEDELDNEYDDEFGNPPRNNF